MVATRVSIDGSGRILLLVLQIATVVYDGCVWKRIEMVSAVFQGRTRYCTTEKAELAWALQQNTRPHLPSQLGVVLGAALRFS